MFDIFSIATWIKTRFALRDMLIVAGIVVLFGLSRGVSLDRWPIFSDEGIYIRWAKVAWKDASWRFISVTDGRQPLQTWGTIPFLKLFSPNDLVAGRMFSVATGAVALAGMMTLLYMLWGKRAMMVGGIIYVFSPYFLFYDRMALVDSAVNAGFLWILVCSILLARTRRLDIALFMGFVGGFALLAKSSSRMFLAIAGLAPLLFLRWPIGSFLRKTVNYWILLGIAVSIAMLFYNVQRLSPYFHYVELKNITFVMSLSEFLETPFAYVKHNARLIPLYVSWNAGFVILIPALLGLAYLLKKDTRLALYLLLFIILPYIAIAFFAKILFSRYILFMNSIITIYAVFFFVMMRARLNLILSLGALLVSMTALNYPILFDPPRTVSFPPVDRGQYIEGKTAVWGAADLSEFFKEQAKIRPVLVLAEGDFGLVADVLKVYIQDGDGVEIKGFWPLDENTLFTHQEELKNRDVYVVFSHREEFPDAWPIERVTVYTKPNSQDALYVYRLLPATSLALREQLKPISP